MSRPFNRHLALLAVLGVACANPAAVWAQGRLEVSARGSWVPLTSGNATFGPTHGWGLTTSVAITLDQLGASEVYGFYTLVPRNTNPYYRTPRIQMAGAMLSLSLGIESRLTGVGMVGVGVINYSAELAGPCDQPFCAPDGIVSYRGGRHPTFIAGLGLEGALSSRLRLRADVKEHLPIGDEESAGFTGDRRSDIGVGLRYLVR